MIIIPAPIHHSDSQADPKVMAAFWIACHVLPIVVMLISLTYSKVKGEWRGYNLPPLFEFFGIWLLAVLFIDAFLLVTYIITLFI